MFKKNTLEMRVFLIIASLLLAQFSMAQLVSDSQSPKVWSLQDCIDHALANNITLKDAALSTDIAAVEYSRSRSAKLPNLFGSASEILSSGNSIDPITSEYITDQIHSGSLGLNSSMTLYKGNQMNNQIKKNSILLEQGEQQEEVEKNSIVLSILEMYVQALYSKESITIAENNLNASEKEVLRSKARLDAETIALSDYTEAQSQAATNKYIVIAAKNNYAQYIIALKQLLELPPAEELTIDAIDESNGFINTGMNATEVYDKALGLLPEIKVNNLNIAANEKQLDLTRGGYLPTVTLNGSLGSGYTSFNTNPLSDQFNLNFNQRLGVTLSIPIFNRNQTKAAVNTATINILKAQLQKESTEKEIYKKVEVAYQNALSSQEQMLAAQTSQDAAEQTYQLAQKRYELGDLSTTDLVISQNTYTNAQQNYLQAKYLNILYYQTLQFYQGNDINL